jgi:tRNA pseudouridine55 synthase
MTIDRSQPGSGSGAFEGVVLLDKAAGMSSNAALQAVRRLFGGAKGGHTGTLDPLATGLLPVCLGAATKFAGVLLETDKTYEAVVGLGLTTTTGDAEGEPLFRGRVEGCLERLGDTLAALTGEIDQLPPMFSAIKHQGRALYRYARAGESVERRPRRVTVHTLDLIATRGDEISLRIHCSKGTYIRTLAHDIGERLGCGAHVLALRRTRIGALTIDQALGLEALAALDEAGRRKRLLPADILLSELPAVVLDRVRADAVLQGRPVTLGEPLRAGSVRLYAEDGLFLGLGAPEQGLLRPKRMRALPGGGAGSAA